MNFSNFWNTKTIYRKIILILLAVQLLSFFLIPYSYLDRSLESLSQLVGRLYDPAVFPKKMTGFSMMVLMFRYSGSNGFFPLFLLIFKIGLLLIHCIGTKRLSYIGSLATEIIMIPVESLVIDLADEAPGYELSHWLFFYILMWIAVCVTSIVGICLELRTQAATGPDGAQSFRFDSEKFAQGMGTAGNIITYLAKEGMKKLSHLPETFRNVADNANQSAGSAQNQQRRAGQNETAAGTTRASDPAQTGGQRPASPAAMARTPQTISQTGSITGIRGDFAGAQIPLNNGEEFVLGRGADTCNIILQGDLISRKHCTICYDGTTGSYLVTDYSENGTFIGSGSRLPAGQQVALSAGTVLWIGSKDVTFQLG